MSHQENVNSASFLFKTCGDLAEFTWFVRWGRCRTKSKKLKDGKWSFTAFTVHRTILPGSYRYAEPSYKQLYQILSKSFEFHCDTALWKVSSLMLMIFNDLLVKELSIIHFVLTGTLKTKKSVKVSGT